MGSLDCSFLVPSPRYSAEEMFSPVFSFEDPTLHPLYGLQRETPLPLMQRRTTHSRNHDIPGQVDKPAFTFPLPEVCPDCGVLRPLASPVCEHCGSHNAVARHRHATSRSRRFAFALGMSLTSIFHRSHVGSKEFYKMLYMSDLQRDAYFNTLLYDVAVPFMGTGDLLIFAACRRDLPGQQVVTQLTRWTHIGLVIRRPGPRFPAADAQFCALLTSYYDIPAAALYGPNAEDLWVAEIRYKKNGIMIPMRDWLTTRTDFPQRDYPQGPPVLDNPYPRLKSEGAARLWDADGASRTGNLAVWRRLLLPVVDKNNIDGTWGPAFWAFLVENARVKYETHKAHLARCLLKDKAMLRHAFVHRTDYDTCENMFCTEFVGHMYRNMGLLPRLVMPANLSPPLMTSQDRYDSLDVELCRGAVLATERRLRIVVPRPHVRGGAPPHPSWTQIGISPTEAVPWCATVQGRPTILGPSRRSPSFWYSPQCGGVPVSCDTSVEGVMFNKDI